MRKNSKNQGIIVKKRISLLVLASFVFLFVPATVSAQIRDYVGIVRSTIHPSSITYLEKLRDSLKSDGYVNLPETIDGYIKGGFGSGFVYVAQNGKNYIVTNRHVVSQAYETTIEFEHLDGTFTKYEGLKVLAIDEDIDLAILAFPEGVKPFKEGLQFETVGLDDGAEIWSAGFPALGNNPMWQLGKGTITNSRARVPELADPDKTTLIQHSAQIDSGNSGGPLLVSAKNVTGGYRVIGINTWKAVNRQAANYSIPSSTVITFVNRVLAPVTVENAPKLVEERSSAFVNLLASKKPAYQYIVKYISYDYVAATGSAALKSVLSTAPASVRDDILSIFGGLSPVEAMRYSIAYGIEKRVTDKAGKIFISVDSVSENGEGSFKTLFTSPTDKWNCVWKSEHGLWRITSFGDDAAETTTDGKKKKDSKKSDGDQAFVIESPYIALLSGTWGFTLDTDASSLIGGQILIGENDYFTTGMSFYNQKGDVKMVDSQSFNPRTLTSNVSASVVQILARLQVPFQFPDFSIVPFAQGGWGIGIMTFENDFSLASGYSISGGVLAGLGAEQRFFLELGYTYRSIGSFGALDAKADDLNTSNITLSAGLGLN